MARVVYRLLKLLFDGLSTVFPGNHPLHIPPAIMSKMSRRPCYEHNFILDLLKRTRTHLTQSAQNATA